MQHMTMTNLNDLREALKRIKHLGDSVELNFHGMPVHIVARRLRNEGFFAGWKDTIEIRSSLAGHLVVTYASFQLGKQDLQIVAESLCRGVSVALWQATEYGAKVDLEPSKLDEFDVTQAMLGVHLPATAEQIARGFETAPAHWQDSLLIWSDVDTNRLPRKSPGKEFAEIAVSDDVDAFVEAAPLVVAHLGLPPEMVVREAGVDVSK